MARKAQPKFPKKTAGEPGGFFFALRHPVAAAAVPPRQPKRLNCLN
ncbi:hypothetical protein [Burkholderia ubonensis]|nr:hypothetical protein [Burkholderia ubonensis]